MIHILHVLMIGYAHIHNLRTLFAFYLHHHAIQFLRSGVTSQSPGSFREAWNLLVWLVLHHMSPVDW